MRLSYTVTGMERKALVGAISHALNAPTKYLGMPSAAYQVGGYTIDKAGTVTGKDSLDLEETLRQQGFDAVVREYDEPSANESGPGENGMTVSDVPKPVYRHYQAELSDPDCPDRMEFISAENDGDALRQAYEFCEGEVILLELLETDADYDVIRGVEITLKGDRLTIEIPLDGFTPEKLDILFKMVNAKAPLLKATLGVDDLPIQQTADTLRFPWFGGGLDAETVKAYTTLIGMICVAAKEKHRVIAREKDPENKKYAMRTWLLSLGFIGDAYKTSRRILLRNLSGNSSYAKKNNMENKP